jgi:bifunctional non-homologous end joining protein LigD
MSLQTYRAKRRFERTPEPAGKPRRGHGSLRFVVQKHEASRLHYDFRLELDGALKSWAVPKGPSLNPADKRLAIMVEDHPLDYRKFEGTIPEGNYGAGTVMVWDEGTYEPVEAWDRAANIKRVREELEGGHLRFILHGHKLQGQFSLVKLKRGKGNEWLLFKHRDDFSGDEDVLEQDRSAVSRRTLEQIADHAPRRGKLGHPNGKPQRSVARGRASTTAAKSTMPHRVRPMLATFVDQPFDRPDWFFEVKWDGYRAIAEIEKVKVRLYSRRFLPFETKFAAVARALRGFAHDAVLDGEIVALDAQGRSHFQLLQNYQKTGAGTLVYYVFDLLYLDGTDLRAQPLRRRKELLAPLLKESSTLRLSEHIEEKGVAFFEAAAKQGLEGIIAKNAASPYREGIRSWDWLKIKARKQQEAVIGGFTQPRGTRRRLGALVLGVYEGDDLVYIGHTGSGFNAASLQLIHGKLAPLIQSACPFKIKPKTNAPVDWVKPTVVCEVAFQDWTQEGIMRQPIFLGLREDKLAREVKRELPKSLPETTQRNSPSKSRAKHSSPQRKRGKVSAKSAPPAELPAGNFSNLDKIYWPEEGFTKGDALRYYHEMAPVMLPYLRDRPLVLNRHPNGIKGKNFFQKDVSRQPPPDWVRTVKIHSESKNEELLYVVGDDEATLLYAANLGCIEMNPWNSRVAALDHPDYLIIDLDPEDLPFTEVVQTALEVRKLLEKRCAECYCKTSGKRGLHVYLPLGARYPYDQARQFAEIIARLVHNELPETTSLARSPSQRRHKVYLDYLQNSRGQTLAAPYSLRPIAGARVSTPLHWREVNKKLDPGQFTMETMPRRLDKVGDLWTTVLGKGIDLEKCLREFSA